MTSSQPESDNPVEDTEEYLDDLLDQTRITLDKALLALENATEREATFLELIAALRPIEALEEQVEAVAEGIQDAGAVAAEGVEAVTDAADVPVGIVEDTIADAAALPAAAKDVASGKKYRLRRRRRG